jgi:hypothetical protein
MNATDAHRLASALRKHAADWYPTPKTPAEDWRTYMTHVLATAEIEVSSAQLERAWHTCWQRSFMGGNYMLDAKAILQAMAHEAGEPSKIN